MNSTLNNAIQSSVHLWVRSEPLTYGMLYVNPHQRLLSLHNIKKLVNYARVKGKTGYPKLSYSIWKHIACNKLQLSDSLAWSLFYTCFTMSAISSQKLKILENRIFTCQNSEDQENIKLSISLDLFKFVLYLYLQQINKISLRANAASPNAEWPEAKRSVDGEMWKSENKNMDETQHLQFIVQNISDVLDILAEPNPNKDSGFDSYGNKIDNPNPYCLSTISIEALNLIIEGRLDKNGSVKPLTEIIHSSPVFLSKVGYNQVTKTYNIRSVSSWLRSHLNSNPFGKEACLNQGRRLAWNVNSINTLTSSTNSLPGSSKYQTGDDQQNFLSLSQTSIAKQYVRRQRIITTANLLPRGDAGKGNKHIIITCLYNQTIARSSGTLENATLKLHRCYYSYLYLLSPLRCVSIEKCRKSTIVLGPTENTIQMIQCEDCVVIAPTRRLVLIGCRRITLYVCVASWPLICQSCPSNTNSNGGPGMNNGLSRSSSESLLNTSSSSTNQSPGSSTNQFGPNEDICFAPYCSSYLNLEDHLSRVQIDPKINLWNKPIVLGSSLSPSLSTSASTLWERCWELLPPADFYPITVPFEMDQSLLTNTNSGISNTSSSNKQLGTTIVCPVPWPIEYEDALKQRSQRYENLRAMIKNARLTPEQSKMFRTLVEKRFQSWLTESDEYRQLILLDPSSVSSTLNSANNNNSSSNVNNTPSSMNSTTVVSIDNNVR